MLRLMSRRRPLTFDLRLLHSDLLLLPLYDITHLVQVVMPSDKFDLVETASRDLQVLLVVPICFRQVVDLLEEDVRDHLDVVSLRMLAHSHKRVSERHWLTSTTQSGL